MITRNFIFSLAAASLGTLVFTSVAFAARGADLNVLVVDQQRVLRESFAGHDMARQGQMLRDQIQQEIVQEQNAILALQQDIQKNAKILSPAQRQQKIQQFEQRRQGYQAFEQRKSQVLQLSVERAQGQIVTALKPVLQQVIDERKITLMLDRQVVMYALPSLDVTDEIVKRLNNVIRSVKVERVDFQQPVSRPPTAPGKPPIGIAKPH